MQGAVMSRSDRFCGETLRTVFARVREFYTCIAAFAAVAKEVSDVETSSGIWQNLAEAVVGVVTGVFVDVAAVDIVDVAAVAAAVGAVDTVVRAVAAPASSTAGASVSIVPVIIVVDIVNHQRKFFFLLLFLILLF